MNIGLTLGFTINQNIVRPHVHSLSSKWKLKSHNLVATQKLASHSYLDFSVSQLVYLLNLLKHHRTTSNVVREGECAYYREYRRQTKTMSTQSLRSIINSSQTNSHFCRSCSRKAIPNWLRDSSWSWFDFEFAKFGDAADCIGDRTGSRHAETLARKRGNSATFG